MRSYAIRLSAALVSFLVGIASVNFLPDSGFGTSSRGESESEILEIEREYIRAHLERDVAALDKVLADDFTSFRGRVRKEHRLALLANPFFIVTSFSTERVRVRVRGDAAWVRGTARMAGSLGGHEFDTPPYRFSRRYERRGGRWQIVSCRFSFRE
jgi:ketosteroid isomerase-like protein